MPREYDTDLGRLASAKEALPENGRLTTLFHDLMGVQDNLNRLNNRMEATFDRIVGTRPETSGSSGLAGCGPATDGILALLECTIPTLRSAVSRIENQIDRLDGVV